MANPRRILLVEGKSDEAFYSEICKRKALNIDVKVAPPRDAGGTFNSKEGIFQLLPTLLNQFSDGSIERLGVVMDADYRSEHGLGYSGTLNRMESILSRSGFSLSSNPNLAGKVFCSKDGFHDVGLWVMPDNHNEGMLEDWIKSGIVAQEQALLNTAQAATNAVPQKKFRLIHQTKAEIATWLAWQDKPGRGMEYSVQAELLDVNAPQFLAFTAWLTHIFS